MTFLSKIYNKLLYTCLIESFPDEEEEEEEEGDEEDVVGTEPKLKYERLSSDLKIILADDSASAIAVHPKFMVLGKHRPLEQNKF